MRKTPAGEVALKSMADFLKSTPQVTRLRVDVHADTVGDTELAAARAKAVIALLEEQGVDPSRLTWRGLGPSQGIVVGQSTPAQVSAFTVEDVDGGGARSYAGETIYFATDRRANTASWFDDKRAPPGVVSYGECRVKIPEDAAQPRHRIWNATHWIGPDHAAYAVDRVVPAASFAALTGPLAQDLAQAGEDEQDALVFVHGFNNTFADACARAAEVAYGLDFRGPVFLFSWPSHGGGLTGIPEYESDLSNANSTSAAHLSDLLESIFTEVHPKKIHVLAHSMGTQIALTALKTACAQKFRLGEVVFAAADLDAEEFKLSKLSVTRRTERVTIYASGADKALIAARSALVHGGYGRLGAKPLSLGDWFDTIDATGVQTEPLRHSYIFEKAVLADVRAVLHHEKPDAATRQGWLKQKRDGNEPAWYELTELPAPTP